MSTTASVIPACRNRIQPVLRRHARKFPISTSILQHGAQTSGSHPCERSLRSAHSSARSLQDDNKLKGAVRRKQDSRYNFNTSLSFDEEPDPEHLKYRRVTAKDLTRRHEPPTRVKMLVRDFIDDSLYNPHYGYFSKQAEVFSSRPSTSSSSSTATKSEEALDISAFPNLTAFQEAIADQYTTTYGRPTKRGRAAKLNAAVTSGEQADVVPSESSAQAVNVVDDSMGGLGRQVWHTPTELFKPHYARVICRALLSHYLLHHYPYSDFQLYEIGAGNGSLMIDMLSFLRERYPHVFDRTKYTIIEISEPLAKRQRERVERMEREDPAWKGKVRVENVDWFEWEGGNRESCYFVALEVFDNFAHDMIRYDLRSLEPLQALVCVDASGDFSLLYEPITDPVIRRYLGYRRLLPSAPGSSSGLIPPINPLILSSSFIRNLYLSMPFAPNLSKPEFIPTKQMLFLERLREQLPFHKLLVSDFDSLPDAVEGLDGPVVQTRYGGSMVPCETFLVKQGYFDIFFPTNFERLRDIYTLIMNSSSRRLSPSFFSPQNGGGGGGNGNNGNGIGKRSKKLRLQEEAQAVQSRSDLIGIRGFRQNNVRVSGHAEFLEEFADEEDLRGTTTRDGGNVMLGMYKNAKFLF